MLVPEKLATPPPRQEIRFQAIEGVSLASILQLPDPHFVSRADAHRQLDYIDGYVRHQALGCKSVIVEEHYIDRDYIEDYSVFYSKCLTSYANFCRRVHFFSLLPNELKKELRRLRHLRSQSEQNSEYMNACNMFSDSHYIGFAVIKPLPGCPVGRTVLRPLPEQSESGHVRKFKCVCDFDVHTLGVPLQVAGLPFQQQDLGVSACATTALWMCLHRARQLEGGSLATPSQITIRANQFTLPFGRPMPSEGLSLDQMCQAVQSLGYSPSLYRSKMYDVTRALLFSSLASGFTPVLILDSRVSEDRHAVALAGMAIKRSAQNHNTLELRHRAEDMVGLYVHDDRYGPYLKATIAKQEEKFIVRYQLSNKTEDWQLTHILVPLHAKIRLSFGELYRAGLKLLHSEIQPFLQAIGARGTTTWSPRIFRSHIYIDSLLKRPGMDQIVQRLCETVCLSRYVGVIRFETDALDAFDVVLDTTSTERNLDCIAVVQLGSKKPVTSDLCSMIAKTYNAITIS